MEEDNSLMLLFDPHDYVEGKLLIAETLGPRAFEPLRPTTELYDGAELAGLLLKLGTISIPALAALLALWLGKGKNITLKRGNAQLQMSNVKESTAVEIVKAFLDTPNK